MSKVNVHCHWCHSLFKARQADLNRGWGKFCSKSCKAKEQEKRTGQNLSYQLNKSSNLSRVDSLYKVNTNRESLEIERLHKLALDQEEYGWDGHK